MSSRRDFRNDERYVSFVMSTHSEPQLLVGVSASITFDGPGKWGRTRGLRGVESGKNHRARTE